MNSISSVSFCERKPNIKKEEKVINGISEHVRGFRMALNRQIPKEQLETQPAIQFRIIFSPSGVNIDSG